MRVGVRQNLIYGAEIPDKRSNIDAWPQQRQEWARFIDDTPMPNSLREIHSTFLAQTDKVLVTSKHANQLALLILGRGIKRFLKANDLKYLPGDIQVPEWIRTKSM